MKTEGALRKHAYHLSWFLLMATVGTICAVSLATLFLSIDYWQRWFEWPNVMFISPIPIAVEGNTMPLLKALSDQRDYRPFVLSLALLGLCFVGLGVSMRP